MYIADSKFPKHFNSNVTLKNNLLEGRKIVIKPLKSTYSVDFKVYKITILRFKFLALSKTNTQKF